MCKVLSQTSIWQEFIQSELSINYDNNVCYLKMDPDTIEKKLEKVGNQFWSEFVLPITGKTDPLEIRSISPNCKNKPNVDELKKKSANPYLGTKG